MMMMMMSIQSVWMAIELHSDKLGVVCGLYSSAFTNYRLVFRVVYSLEIKRNIFFFHFIYCKGFDFWLQKKTLVIKSPSLTTEIWSNLYTGGVEGSYLIIEFFINPLCKNILPWQTTLTVFFNPFQHCRGNQINILFCKLIEY